MHRHGLTTLAVFAVIALLLLQLPPMVAKQDSVFRTYRALVEVDALAKQQYVERIDDDRLVDGAIRGMMLQLDPYSGYIAPDELAAFHRRSAGEYIGVGVAVGVRDGRLTVIAPVDHSPASAAGILAGDVILAIDGEDAKGLSVFDANERLTGKPGTRVTLTLLHPRAKKPVDVAIVRGPVSVATVRGFRKHADGSWDYLLDPDNGIAYVRISSFHENTLRDFDETLRDALHQGTRDLILDLRFNPGGLMDQAVGMVDRFIDAGLIVATVTRRKAIHEYTATAEGTLRGPRLVVLINGGSASSSEIVAGALQDHKRAMIVGERSFGKGSVQHLLHLETHSAAIKLTVAYYRLPSGRVIHRLPHHGASDAWGVEPDVTVTLSDKELAAIQASRRAVDNARSISRQDVHATDEAHAPMALLAQTPRIAPDRQLAAALDLLAGERTTFTHEKAPTPHAETR